MASHHDFLKKFKDEYYHKLGKRSATFSIIIENLLRNKQSELVIVETGTTRKTNNWEGDGQSTRIFDDLVNFVGGRVISIDIDPVACEISDRLTSDKTTVICSDAIPALYQLGCWIRQPIDLLYLDSYDVSFDDDMPSAVHHLMEFSMAARYLNDPCILAIDDTLEKAHGYYENGEFVVLRTTPYAGKGRLISLLANHLGINPTVKGYQTAFNLENHNFSRIAKGVENLHFQKRKLDFTFSGELPDGALQGFSRIEAEGRWTDGKHAALIHIRPEGPVRKIRICARAYVPDDHEQRVKMFIGGNCVHEEIYNNRCATKTVEFDLPELEDDLLRLDFLLPNALSPMERGRGNDKRKLGIMIKTVEFVEN